MTRTTAGLVLLLGLGACSKTPGEKKQPAAPAASPSAPAASASAAEKPWYLGTWEGTYTAKLARIEMAKEDGAVHAWKKDDGEKAAGDGTMTLVIGEDGGAVGTARGPLGEQSLRGKLQPKGKGLSLRATGSAESPAESFSGVVLLTKKGAAFEGKLRVSSGDSLLVRAGPVTLTRKEEAAAP